MPSGAPQGVGQVQDHVAVVTRNRPEWIETMFGSAFARAATAGIPTPAFSSSLAYYDGVRADHLPAALIQGLRDLFGAHTYRRVDDEGAYHVRWGQDGSEVRTDG